MHALPTLKVSLNEITTVSEASLLLEALVRNGGRITQTLAEFGWVYSDWVRWRRRVPSDLSEEIEMAVQFGKLKKVEDCDNVLHGAATEEGGETETRIKAAAMLLKLEKPSVVTHVHGGAQGGGDIADRLFGGEGGVRDVGGSVVVEVSRGMMEDDPFGVE